MRFVIGSMTATLVAVGIVSIGADEGRAEPPGGAPAQEMSPPVLSQREDYKHSWIEVDGIRAHYIEAGTRDPFVLVHGNLAWSSGEANYGEVVGPLGEHFHAIAPDIVGYGYTTPRGPEHYSGEAQAKFLIRFIEALGVGPVFLTGNSHGGFLTQYVALHRPDLVRKLVITNSGSGTSPLASRPDGERYLYAPGHRQYRSRTVDEIRTMLERYYEHRDLVTEERVKLVHDLWQRNYEYADARGRAVENTIEIYDGNQTYKGKHISDRASELQMPVLLMWSQPGSRIEWGLTHYFKIPGAEMHILPWSGHHLFTDQSARWAQVVTGWLKNDPPRPPDVDP